MFFSPPYQTWGRTISGGAAIRILTVGWSLPSPT